MGRKRAVINFGAEGTLGPALEATARAQLHAAMVATAGDRDAAAAVLGISRRTLYEWLDAWPEIREEFPASPGPPKKRERPP